MPIYRHATLRRNLASIRRHGLLACKSRGRLRAVWLVAPGAASWALLHVCRRHQAVPADVVLLEVRLPRSWTRRAGRKRLWFTLRDVPAARIGRAIAFGELASADAV